PVTQITLTEGAIGYRRFGVIKGIKAMAAIRLEDGSWPPFGASVQSNGREVGILDDDGLVWLSGIEAGASMDVRWNGETQCQLALPDPLPQQLLDEGQNLLLLCTRRAAPASST
ncbi:FimD/PapC C-terminal domain-containing protein, partial [Pantoea sp. R102]